jgi:hypothetical protein
MSDKLVIGIDPDSKKHGVSFYLNGNLTNLESMEIIELYEWVKNCPIHHASVEIHIEDVNGVSASFGARDKSGANMHMRLKMAQHIGMCKQSQIEVERVAQKLGVKLVKHKLSKKWKSAKIGKPEFEKLTGWSGRSNEDTRSAAWFGYIGSRE